MGDISVSVTEPGEKTKLISRRTRGDRGGFNLQIILISVFSESSSEAPHTGQAGREDKISLTESAKFIGRDENDRPRTLQRFTSLRRAGKRTETYAGGKRSLLREKRFTVKA